MCTCCMQPVQPGKTTSCYECWHTLCAPDTPVDVAVPDCQTTSSCVTNSFPPFDTAPSFLKFHGTFARHFVETRYPAPFIESSYDECRPKISEPVPSQNRHSCLLSAVENPRLERRNQHDTQWHSPIRNTFLRARSTQREEQRTRLLRTEQLPTRIFRHLA